MDCLRGGASGGGMVCMFAEEVEARSEALEGERWNIAMLFVCMRVCGVTLRGVVDVAITPRTSRA